MTTPFKPAPPAAADPGYEGLVTAATLAASAGTVIRASRDQSLQDAIGKPAALSELPKFRLPTAAPTRTSLPEDSAQMMAALGWVDGDPIPPEIAATIGPLRAKRQDLKPIAILGLLEPAVLQRLKDAVLSARVGAAAKPSEDMTLQMMEAGPITVPTEEPDSFADKRTEDTGLVPVACRRCGFKNGDPDPVEPTHTDKLNYLLYMRGHTDTFVKSYPLFGGACTLTFRVLTIKELEDLMAQALSDLLNGLIPQSASAYDLHVQKYRLAIGTVEIERDGRVTRVPAIAGNTDAVGGDPTMPVIPRLLSWYTANAIATESLFRVAYQAYAGFNRLVEQLELQATNGDFWQGIDKGN